MIRAVYFDGKSASRQQVELQAMPGRLMLRGEDFARDEPLPTLKISSKVGSSPRMVYFSDGAHCEVADHAGFESLLSGMGARPVSTLSRMEASWPYALVAVMLFLAFLAGSYYWGLPVAANAAARKIPYRIAHEIDTHVLKALDGGMLLPSKLSAARQKALTKEFENLHMPSDLPPHTLLFRNSPAIGPNAFALPGGTIVMTDQLVKLAGNDQELLAVLGHEMGHVAGRHPLRNMLQSSVVALAMSWYLGDVSNLLAAPPTLLLQTHYSRGFETDADSFAVNLMRDNHIPPTRLADILEKLEAVHLKREQARHHGKVENDSGGMHISDYFATHPATDERIRAIRAQAKREGGGD